MLYVKRKSTEDEGKELKNEDRREIFSLLLIDTIRRNTEIKNQEKKTLRFD